MTDNHDPTDQALRLLAESLEANPELADLVLLVKRWKEKPEVYDMLVELADLDRRRKALDERRKTITIRLTFDLAPPEWRALLDADRLPADFNAWKNRDWQKKILHQAGISAGQQLTVGRGKKHGSVPKLIKQLRQDGAKADLDKWKNYTRQAYEDEAKRFNLDPVALRKEGQRLLDEKNR